MEILKRDCPKCLGEIIYKTIAGFNSGNKSGAICRKCASSGINNGMYGKNGVKNPFYGKSHSQDTIDKLKSVDRLYTQTSDFRNKQSNNNSGDKNNMFGKRVFDVWVEKFGIDIANEKMISFKNKLSDNNSGNKNNMFGKPSPTGSGNGWSGWYKGWYFRSIRELTYMIKIIERFNLKWESAETNNYRIPYLDYNGNLKNYFPDFVISNKYLIESKPKKLWGSDTVQRKAKAAVKFAEANGLKYKMVDIGKLSNDEIKNLYNLGLIKFIDRYEKQYKIKIIGNDK